MSGPAPEAPRGMVVLCLAAVWVLWGSAYLAIRLIIEDLDPFQAMAQRFLVAGSILAAVVLLRRGPGALRVTRRESLSLVVTGVLLLGLGNGLQALAQVQGIASGVAALLIACAPAWAVLLRVATGDRPSALTWLGVAVGFAGLVVLVVLGRGVGGAIPLVGVLLCVGASLSWTVGGFVQGYLRLPRDIFTVAAYQQLVAAGCSTVLAVSTGEHFSVDYSARGWFAFAWLVGACSVVAFLAFAWLLRHVPLSLTATHAYVNPVVAVLLGWAVLAEPIGPPVLLGGGIVVAAVVLIVRAERPRALTPDGVPADVAVIPPAAGEAPAADVTRLTQRG